MRVGMPPALGTGQQILALFLTLPDLVAIPDAGGRCIACGVVALERHHQLPALGGAGVNGVDRPMPGVVAIVATLAPNPEVLAPVISWLMIEMRHGQDNDTACLGMPLGMRGAATLAEPAHGFLQRERERLPARPVLGEIAGHGSADCLVDGYLVAFKSCRRHRCSRCIEGQLDDVAGGGELRRRRPAHSHLGRHRL